MQVDLHLGNAVDIVPTLGAFDVLITDPPYGIEGGKGHQATAKGKGKYIDATWENTEAYIGDVVVPLISRLLKDCKRAAITPGYWALRLYPKPDDVGCFWTPASTAWGRWGHSTFQPILYYGKDWRAGKGQWPNGKRVTEKSEKNGHPCPKPIKAWSWLVGKVSMPGEVVLDPFMGSGTTGVACVNLERNFIGIEITPAYFEIAQRRIAEAQLQIPLGLK